MDLIKEVTLLKYQFRLMQSMIQSDEFPFYNFVIDWELEEEQVKVLTKILIVFHDRLTKEEVSIFGQNDHLFSKFKLPLDMLYSSQKPNLNEFKLYITKIFYQEFELKYLLLNLKKQCIFVNVCDHLLEQLQISNNI
ncbi:MULTISPECIES: DUF1878 family protein [Bacillales]|uniref:DUF1878 family protein n=1 Tax=Bacillales TaxID=1385 RepID=UPI00190E34B0|nr:DUF1878 family protein [Staphylococcus aureus]MBK3311742.1 DUF1878 family protein [Staphylococcus aureus]WAI29827.1 MAG: DUF1878 family protein [Bacillus paranthracis]WAI35700.1 MAG: DUF1878 family protein [Bacillus paranthracis]WAI41526.1 MAG: DUF1878 family protein [Bacillus paranthracis]